VKVDETTVNGTTIDVKDDLDMDTSEMVPELRLDLRLSEHDRLLAGFTTVSYDGDTAIEQTLTYNGKAYVAGETVRSSFDLTMVGLFYERILVDRAMTDGVGELGVVGGVDVMWVEGKLSGTISGAARESITVPVPMIGLTGQVDLIEKKLNLEAWITALKFDVSDKTATVVDGYFAARFNVMDNFSVGAGYRYVGFDGGTGGDEESVIDVGIGGFFFDVLFRF
jgi:opacity protein-like surface antigen